MKDLRDMKKGADLSVENPTGNAVANNATGTKQPYVKPQSEMVKMELEQPILQMSGENGRSDNWR